MVHSQFFAVQRAREGQRYSRVHTQLTQCGGKTARLPSACRKYVVFKHFSLYKSSTKQLDSVQASCALPVSVLGVIPTSKHPFSQIEAIPDPPTILGLEVLRVVVLKYKPAHLSLRYSRRGLSAGTSTTEEQRGFVLETLPLGRFTHEGAH